MKGSSKVMMGATLSMVMILVIVLALVFVLLAELYCSLLRRRKLEATKPSENPRPEQAHDQSTPSPLSSFYCHGVLDAPRSFLFPKLPSKREKPNDNDDDIEKQKHGKLHEFLRVRSPVLQMGLPSSSSQSPCVSVPEPEPRQCSQEPEIQVEVEGKSSGDESCYGGSKRDKNFMYISNPIYDNDLARPTRVETDTPFGTPDSSPSHLGDNGSSGEEGGNPDSPSPSSLPVTPMKELLPVKASCSVGLKGARSLGNSVISDSTSHIGKSSSSGSPRTSPSW